MASKMARQRAAAKKRIGKEMGLGKPAPVLKVKKLSSTEKRLRDLENRVNNRGAAASE